MENLVWGKKKKVTKNEPSLPTLYPSSFQALKVSHHITQKTLLPPQLRYGCHLTRGPTRILYQHQHGNSSGSISWKQESESGHFAKCTCFFIFLHCFLGSGVSPGGPSNHSLGRKSLPDTWHITGLPQKDQILLQRGRTQLSWKGTKKALMQRILHINSGFLVIPRHSLSVCCFILRIQHCFVSVCWESIISPAPQLAVLHSAFPNGSLSGRIGLLWPNVP